MNLDRLVRDGVKNACVGRTHAGKSTLWNALQAIDSANSIRYCRHHARHHRLPSAHLQKSLEPILSGLQEELGALLQMILLIREFGII